MVLKIPEEVYEGLVYLDIFQVRNLIQKGTLLPKGHGRLIDVDAIKPKFCDSNIYIKYGEKGFWYYSVKDVNDTPTIIEADKAEGANE